MKVIVAGGSGLVGRRLTEVVAARGDEVVVLTRDPGRVRGAARPVRWDGRTSGGWGSELAGACAVVNLAGESVGTRPWTRRRREAILESRLDTTRALVGAIAALPPDERPPVLVNASGIDYAGDAGDTVVSEEAEPGTTFLSFVSQQGECAARAAAPFGTRVVLVRTPLVLSSEAVALRLLALPFRLGLGGSLGRGDQWFPWIHIDDLAAVYLHAIMRGRLTGPVHAVAPDQRRQRHVARELASVLCRPAVMRAPAPLLRLALGRRADLLLHGQRAVTEKLEPELFAFPRLREALVDTLR
jgi:uncharacterized protein (TIGR01777 family)